jgi:hypothetical protein
MKLKKKLLPIVFASMLVTSAMAANDVELAAASEAADPDIKLVIATTTGSEISILNEFVGSTNEVIALRHLTNDELEAIDGAALSDRFARLSDNQAAMLTTALAAFLVANSITTWVIPTPPPLPNNVLKLVDLLVCKGGTTALDLGLGMKQLRAMTVADNRGYDIVDISIGGALGLVLPFSQTGCTWGVGVDKGRKIQENAKIAVDAKNATLSYANSTRGLLGYTQVLNKFTSQSNAAEAYINQAKVHRKILNSHIQSYYQHLYIKKNCLQQGAAAVNCTNVQNAAIANRRSAMWSAEATINRFMHAAGSVMKQRMVMTGMSVKKVTPRRLLMIRAEKNDFRDEN